MGYGALSLDAVPMTLAHLAHVAAFPLGILLAGGLVYLIAARHP